jgi:hypothetical protein
MASELEKSLKSAAEKIAQYIDDAATMTVETRTIEISAQGVTQFDQAQAVARSVVRMDGDSETVVPVRPSGKPGQTEVDAALYELHQRNVATAIEYRARILSALLDALKPGGA